MTELLAPTTNETPFFPFTLKDLKYWVVKRKDGLIIKYTVIGPEEATTESHAPTHRAPGHPPAPSHIILTSPPSLRELCKHNPADDPVWQGKKVDLYIADCVGCKLHHDEFTFVLDCGDILSSNRRGVEEVLEGDPQLIQALNQYCALDHIPARVLKVDWADRAAPPLLFDFWPAYVDQVQAEGGTVLTACQGGHGRSGTSLVCLMMVLNPEYTPADAIIHLRAIHCARAIESVAQHVYIGEFGAFLGRVNDVERVQNITDFRKEFLSLPHASAKPYQERLLKTHHGA